MTGPHATSAVPAEGIAGALFRLAVGGLGLTPAAAWAASPREVLLALGPVPGGDGVADLSRVELDALIARYPDRPRPSPVPVDEAGAGGAGAGGGNVPADRLFTT